MYARKTELERDIFCKKSVSAEEHLKTRAGELFKEIKEAAEKGE